MNPQALPGMIANSMGQNIPMPQQVTQASPNFDPSLQPQPTIPTPNEHPMSPLHQAMARRGLTMPVQPTSQPNPMATTSFSPQPIEQALSPQSPGGAGITKTEAEKIIEALSKRLEHLGKRDMVDRGVV